MVLPDLLAPDLDIVFCGTAAGDASARQGAYYAGRGNAFWPTLHQVGLTPRQLMPREYPELLTWRMGLTDMVKLVSGNDEVLSKEQFDVDRLRLMVRDYRPRILAFTSKRAAREFVGRPVGYGCLAQSEGDTALFVLPSPSGAARRHWTPLHWQALADLRGGR